MARAKPHLKVLYISQLADPAEVDLSVFAGLPDGEEDTAWFESRLRELGVRESIELHTVQVCLGQTAPSLREFDAAVIGGSYHMVGDGHRWQRHLMNWLEAAWDIDKPCFGICGGHQLMGHLFGAKVERLPDGVCCGTLPVEWSEAGQAHWLCNGVDSRTGFHFGNHEHVAEVPDKATVLATRGSSPAVALDFGQNWVGIQFHPEFTAKAMGRSWQPNFPDNARRYRPSPMAPRLLFNFLAQAGMEVGEQADGR